MTKKLLLIIAATLLTYTVNAQLKNMNKAELPAYYSPQIVTDKIANPHKNYKTTSTDTLYRWYNYGQAMDSLMGGNTSYSYWDYLFPDSTVKAGYGGGYYKPWIHTIGDMLDVTSFNFNDPSFYSSGELMLTTKDTFMLDSLGFTFVYNRFLADTTIVDTLLIELNQTDRNNWWYYGPGNDVCTRLGVDTTFWIGMNYDYTKGELNYNTKKTYKVLLTHENYDSTKLQNGYHYIQLSTKNLGNILPGNVVMSSVKFVPGYTWNDTLGTDTLNNMNFAGFVSYNEVGELQTPYFLNYTKHDYNVSYIIPTNVRYNYSSGWNGYYNPSFAYMWQTIATYDYAYEHHLIDYKVSHIKRPTGIKKNEERIEKIYLYPNPATEKLHIQGSAPEIMYAIKNNLGQEVLRGKSNSAIDIEKLPKGMYTITLTDVDKNYTDKFVKE